MEHWLEVPPQVEDSLAQIQSQEVQEKVLDSSTNNSDALNGSIWDMQASKMYGYRKIMPDSLFVAREDLDTYKEAKVSLGRDR